jgi:hypothetical protein
MFKTNNINDLELIYSILHEQNPDKQIQITYNWNTKEYIIKQTNQVIKNSHPEVPVDVNIEIVYGDSVTGDTPLLLKKDGLVYIETIQSIFNEKQSYEYPEFKIFDKSIRLEKQYSLTDYQIWSDNNWVDIKRIIRHKTDKKIYGILTHSGYVKVTEDHSLLNINCQIIKPTECDQNTLLLTNYPIDFNETIISISKEKAYIYGFFYGDGSCGMYDCKSGVKYSWTLNNSDLNVLKNLKNLLLKEYPDSIPNIYDTIDSSGAYKLSMNNPKKLVDEYRNKFYDSDKYKKVPYEILNSSNEIVQSFFDGYWAADGCRKDKLKIGCTRFDNTGGIGSAGLYYLMKRLGYKVSLNTRNDKKENLRITITKSEQRKITNKIKKINIIENKDGYVYDIETSNCKFGAGVGDIIVKNTDSIFCRFNYNRDNFEKNRIDTFKLATLCGDKLTDEIFDRPPIVLEFEKVFQPFVLLTKKRYIANKFENMKEPFQLKGIDAKGIALTRRDYCQMVKKCYREIIDSIMDPKLSSNEAVDKSLDIFKQYIHNIECYNIDISDLVVSAMLAKSYKTKPVHVILAERLKQRKQEVQIGDRIPYIYIESNDPKLQKSELGEDPKYAIENNLKFNRVCYLEQLAKPILGFYKIVLQHYPDLLDNIIEHVNTKLVKFGGKRLKPSDFKIED